MRHHKLVQLSGHLADAGRDTTDEIVVGHHHDRSRGVAQIVRDGGMKPVVIQEDGVELHFKQLPCQLPFKIIIPEIQILEFSKLQHHPRKSPHESVVAHVQLEQDLHVPDFLRDDPTKPVGIQMQEADIGQIPNLRWEMPRDVTVVEINAGHHIQAGIVQRLGTINAFVAAHVGSHPIFRELIWIGVDCFFPGLKALVRPF